MHISAAKAAINYLLLSLNELNNKKLTKNLDLINLFIFGASI